MGQQDLRNRTTGEIADEARRKGIKNVEEKNKQELLNELGEQDPSAKPGHGGGQGDSPQPSGTDPQEWKNIPGNQS